MPPGHDDPSYWRGCSSAARKKARRLFERERQEWEKSLEGLESPSCRLAERANTSSGVAS